MVLLELTRGKHQQGVILMQKTDVNSSPWNGLGIGKFHKSKSSMNSNIVIGYISRLLERRGGWSH